MSSEEYGAVVPPHAVPVHLMQASSELWHFGRSSSSSAGAPGIMPSKNFHGKLRQKASKKNVGPHVLQDQVLRTDLSTHKHNSEHASHKSRGSGTPPDVDIRKRAELSHNLIHNSASSNKSLCIRRPHLHSRLAPAPRTLALYAAASLASAAGVRSSSLAASWI